MAAQLLGYYPHIGRDNKKAFIEAPFDTAICMAAWTKFSLTFDREALFTKLKAKHPAPPSKTEAEEPSAPSGGEASQQAEASATAEARPKQDKETWLSRQKELSDKGIGLLNEYGMYEGFMLNAAVTENNAVEKYKKPTVKDEAKPGLEAEIKKERDTFLFRLNESVPFLREWFGLSKDDTKTVPGLLVA